MVRKWITTVVIIVAVVSTAIVVYSLARSTTGDVKTPTADISIAKDQAATSDVENIKLGIESYMATNGALPPAADQATLGQFVDPWPSNPWTKAPMQPGAGVGDYTYTPGTGSSFSIVVHLSGGISVPAP